ncbi:MAG: helix-turn-helix domain-containing protein [Bdellovibrionales bacterium]|jgi:excisionase family DNA binding protein|nr:helix-turn-helix domain-containing protein [Bdellovibrionales bacterium]MBT3527225.1 helix-turn-helix domain-containing protein [Bdellovibrionales bacterium]MBT7768290.1 helix-turn-helix domain-containing protein [Bdellovibrionales bacterium]
MKSYPEVMTTDDVLEYLKISRKTLMKLIREGMVPARKVGKNYRYLKSELEKYLKGDLQQNYFK